MTEEDPQPTLTPAQEARVRRMLAEARHTEPVPPEVAEHLDTVLAGLATERPAAAQPAGEPVDLAAVRRRRRRATQLLVAAAAVTVIGAGVPQLLPLTGGSDESASSDGGDAGGRAQPESANDGGAPVDGGLDSGGREGTADPQSLDGLTALEGGGYAAKLRELRDRGRVSATKDEIDLLLPGGLAACRGDAEWGTGRLVAVSYSGEPGVLVYRAPRDGSQRVDLFLCGRDAPARVVRLRVD